MSLKQRLIRVEKRYHAKLGICSKCGKSDEDWTYLLIIHLDQEHDPHEFSCSTCNRSHKVLAFPEEMYQKELRKERAPGCKVKVI